MVQTKPSWQLGLGTQVTLGIFANEVGTEDRVHLSAHLKLAVSELGLVLIATNLALGS